MSAKLKKEYENLLALEKQLTEIAKDEFVDFVKNCNSYFKTEDLKDEFEKNIKLLKTLKEVEQKK
jgi:hypothetical protein